MEQLNKFWNLVIDVWHQGLYGIDIGRILVAILIFIGFLIIRRLFSKLVISRLKAITRLTQSTLDDEALEVLAKPVGFIPVVLGFYLATEYLSLTGDLATIADRIVRSLIVLVLFWGLIKLVAPLSHLVRHLEKVLTETMVDWLIKAIHAALVFVGAATVLEIWGIRIGPILAGLGRMAADQRNIGLQSQRNRRGGWSGFRISQPIGLSGTPP